MVGARCRRVPPQATALFNDVTAVNYRVATRDLKPALASANKIEQVRLGKTLCDGFRAQYRQVVQLARSGK